MVAYHVDHRCKGIVCVWIMCEVHASEVNVLFLCKHEHKRTVAARDRWIAPSRFQVCVR